MTPVREIPPREAPSGAGRGTRCFVIGFAVVEALILGWLLFSRRSW